MAGIAQQQEPTKDANGCPYPPMDHLKPGASVASVVAAAAASGGEFDRKGGNPGPVVVPFGGNTAKPPDGTEVENNTDDQKQESKADEKCESRADEKPREDKIRQDALDELKEIVPHVKEEWLEKCVNARMIADGWTLVQTASWIMDYDNLAPRKEEKRKFTGDFGTANDYSSIRAMLKNVKPDSPSAEYQFYSALKLSQKFPQFSMFSLRQLLQDFDYSYPNAVFAIVEGLEEMMTKQRKTWKDWKRGEFIFIRVQRGTQWYQYPLAVVKGEKTWSKKKARLTAFPTALAHEIRLVEKALFYYEEKCRALMSKLDAEAARRMQLETAIKNGYACECPICYNEYLLEEQVNCTTGHEFCVFCLNQSVDEALAGQLKVSPQGDIPCLIQGCEGLFALPSLCYILTSERMTRLEERLWADFIARAEIPNLFTCFGCGYMEQVDIPVEALRVFECRNKKCKRKWCRECKNLWDTHVGKTCKEMAGDPEEALRKKYDDLMSDVVIRQCMKCHRPLQKDQGCNKITCQCGAYMCYLCRKPISGYDHFCKHPTNPGEGCTICTGCRLWDDPKKVDDELRWKLQMQMQEELFELKLAYAGKKATAAATTPKAPTADTPTAPQQRQFAAIFGNAM